GIVGLTGAVYPAAHDGDRHRVVLRVGGHLFHLCGQFDEGLVLDPRATRTTDDVQRVEAEVDHAADTAGGDVGKDVAARGDFLTFAVIRHGQRHADRVADAAADQLLEGDPRLDDTVRRHARLSHAQV